MKLLKVYIASPYTHGDTAANVRASMDAFAELYKNGFIPFSPLLFHFQGILHPLEYEDWMRIDFEWLDVCDVVLRLPGKSGGADREVEFARDQDKPVFFGMDELLKYYNVREQ